MKGWTRIAGVLPPTQWLAEYRAAWLGADIVAGITLAAYAIPVSLAYAVLAGLSPQVGVYGYLLGGLGYAVDRWWGTSPWLLLAGLLLGLIVGFYDLARTIWPPR